MSDGTVIIPSETNTRFIETRQLMAIQHLSEVAKILEAALRQDPAMAARYATLLASKLEEEGAGRQASTIRSQLAKAPVALLGVASAFATGPIDEETRLATVDIEQPGLVPALVLHPYVENRVAAFLDAVKQYDRWFEAGVSTPNRLLIVGPPGTGKTSIARRIAHDLQLPLVTTRSDTLVSSLLGQTSKNIREVFRFAERQPCVLFLDEFDALAKARADSREIGELQRVVIALIQNIDALSPEIVLVAATNHHELLDPAVWRRFETTLRVGLPSHEDRAEMWHMHLGQVRASEADIDVLAGYSDGMSGAAIRAAAYDVARDTLMRDDDTVTLAQAMRRLARLLWYEQYELFNDETTEMAALRDWAPKVFTLRVLAELFDVSLRQAGNASKGVANARDRSHPSPPVQAD